MARLRITRAREFLARDGPYPVVVDGQPVQSVGNGESVEVDIQPGHREVIVGMPGCKSNPTVLEVDAAGTYHLKVGPRVGRWLTLLTTCILPSSVGFWLSQIPFHITLGCAPAVCLIAYELRLGSQMLYLREIRTRESQLEATPPGRMTRRRRRLPGTDPTMQFSIRWVMVVLAILAILIAIDVRLSR